MKTANSTRTLPAAPPDDSRLSGTAAAQLREIAHELRNPLNALSAIMEIMMQERFGELGNPRYREYAALAHEATGRMITLCDRLVGPTANSDGERSKVGDTIGRIAAMYQPMAEARGVSLTVDLANNLPDISVDIAALNTVLGNLVTNAIKFTPRGGRVTLMARCEPLENVAVFVISDTGVGTDTETLIYGMEPTTGAAHSTVGVHGDRGSGLGLSIADKAVRGMGGSMEIRSRKGAGTCVIVRLPLGPAAMAG